MAEPGYLGEEKQNGSLGVLDEKACRKALASLATLPDCECVRARSNFGPSNNPSPDVNRCCGAEAYEYFLAVGGLRRLLKQFTVQLPIQLTFSARR
jgi:hypothetical protein